MAAANVPANAAAPPASVTAGFWYAGTQLSFYHPQAHQGALAVALDDPALARFLSKLGATVAYQAGRNDVTVTAADGSKVAFAASDPSFTVDGNARGAAFAPYQSGGTLYLPFLDLAKALAVVPVDDDEGTVLQPQIGALDARPDRGATIVTVRGASRLRFKRLSGPSDERLSLAFLGVATTLPAQRAFSSAGVRGVSLVMSGSARNPTTTMTFDVPPGATHVLVPGDSPNVVQIAFAPSGVALEGSSVPSSGDATSAIVTFAVHAPHSVAPLAAGVPATARPFHVALATLPPMTAQPAPATPAPQTATPAPAPTETATPTAYTLNPVTITSLRATTTDAGGFNLRLGISGPVTFEWHRLADNRWYVDLKPATLAIAPQDAPLDNPTVLALRLKPFVGPYDRLPTVRLSLSLPSPRTVSVAAFDGGLSLDVGLTDDPFAVASGNGEIVGSQIVAAIVPPGAPPPTPLPDVTPPASWKFGGESVPTNPRLIVIDPGHGGSDYGAIHNGMNEKDVAFDISRRLKAALTNRGWQVTMTRDTDADVFAPNDSAKEELQARDDVANNAGARFLISVHVNAFTTSELSGTTTYYYRDDSYDLGRAIHDRLSSALPTKDDGLRKENFYVIHHSTMPAVLVETAFLSNPGDAALLRSDAFRQHVAEAIADGVGDYASPGSPLPSGN
jgi:N-acetylmuramoyl-L-alanine amidase CwlD